MVCTLFYIQKLFLKKPTQSLLVITLWKLSKHGVFPFVGLAKYSYFVKD